MHRLWGVRTSVPCDGDFSGGQCAGSVATVHSDELRTLRSFQMNVAAARSAYKQGCLSMAQRAIRDRFLQLPGIRDPYLGLMQMYVDGELARHHRFPTRKGN